MSRNDFHVTVTERMDTFSGKSYKIMSIHCGPYRRDIDARKIKGRANFDYTLIADELRQAYLLGWDRGYIEGKADSWPRAHNNVMNQ